MNNSQINWNMWVCEAKCTPYVASSLMLGFDPDHSIIEDTYDWRDVRTNIPAIKQLCALLCDNGLWWNHKDKTIFAHIEKALKNRINPCEKLMEQVQLFFDNYLDNDKSIFTKSYPYLSRSMNLSPPNQPKEPSTTILIDKLFTTEQRDTRIQEVANEIWKENKTLSKKEVSKKARETMLANPEDKPLLQTTRNSDGLLALARIETIIRKPRL